MANTNVAKLWALLKDFSILLHFLFTHTWLSQVTPVSPVSLNTSSGSLVTFTLSVGILWSGSLSSGSSAKSHFALCIMQLSGANNTLSSTTELLRAEPCSQVQTQWGLLVQLVSAVDKHVTSQTGPVTFCIDISHDGIAYNATENFYCI